MTVCMLMLSFTTRANEPVPASKDVSSSIAEIVASSIDFPDFARTDDFECCVMLRLLIQSDGNLEVDCANCKDSQLRLYVEDNIERISVPEYAQYAGQSVAIKLVFRVIE